MKFKRKNELGEDSEINLSYRDLREEEKQVINDSARHKPVEKVHEEQKATKAVEEEVKHPIVIATPVYISLAQIEYDDNSSTNSAFDRDGWSQAHSSVKSPCQGDTAKNSKS